MGSCNANPMKTNHAEPHDLPHSVVTLNGSIPLALVFLAFAYLAFGRFDLAVVFHAGLVGGYLSYEAVHLMSHARRTPPYLKGLARYRLAHHFQVQRRAYGVTSPVWDCVFGTLPARGQRSAKVMDNLPR